MATIDDIRALQPTIKTSVRNIAEEVGVPVKNHYDWCFSETDGPYLLFEWIDRLFIDNVTNGIAFVNRMSVWSDANPNGLQIQRNRASACSSIIETAFHTKAPIRIGILDGIRQTVGLREVSQATKRELDSIPWYAHHRNVEGLVVVVRGIQQTERIDDGDGKQVQIDQDIAASEQSKRTKTAVYTARNPDVVRDAKLRAEDGCCEFCGKPGFLTAQGDHYLEGHHVIPLSCDGDDAVHNVVAICPEDHRRAHFGHERHEIREQLIHAVLSKHYGKELIDKLLKQSAEILNSDNAQLLEGDVEFGS